MPFDSATFEKPINSLESLAAWLETKDPNEAYNYISNTNCMLCQYFRAKGIDVRSMGTEDYCVETGGTYITLPTGFNDVSNGTIDTFGQALLRCRALIAIAA